MYRLIDVDKNDVILDAACWSWAFLVKSMCNMIKESWWVATSKAKDIKKKQLYWIEFDREIFALACANMLIHKDWKTNLEQLDSRTPEAWSRIAEKPITKVLMNPPFERKYWCLDIVANVLNNVKPHTLCAFILPEKKLEKDSWEKKLLKRHTLKKIIKLPEKTFDAWVTTSIFIFETWTPQWDQKILAYYIEDDWLERVKNQWRQDIKDRWSAIEDYWVDIIKRHENDKENTKQWIDPHEHLSYQMPEKEFEISEEDFKRSMIDYLMFEEWIDIKEFNEQLINEILYNSEIDEKDWNINVLLKKNNKDNNEN